MLSVADRREVGSVLGLSQLALESGGACLWMMPRLIVCASNCAALVLRCWPDQADGFMDAARKSGLIR